ncbi:MULTISPECIES: helix-turn-helix domain-containing protein [Nocardia]|uniref:helix-turn-helix domain-containing protein n=1 Tax=Nocardia TaxID=1817 RepID=UPI0039083C6E
MLILTELRQGPRPVTELAEAVGMGQSAVSTSLSPLRPSIWGARIRGDEAARGWIASPAPHCRVSLRICG